MKLIRFGDPGREKPGIEDEAGHKRDVSAFGEDYDGQFLETGGIERLKEWWAKHKNNCPELPEDARLGPPVASPSKIVCVGLNYAQHAAESGMEVPEEPVLFFKSTTAICGPNDGLVLPKGSEKTDWEVELAIVIGKKAQYAREEEAMSHIAGYALHNDYSERAFQLERGGQWVKGKSCDTFAPLGPYLVTADEVSNPHNLGLWLKVNGKQMQSGNTADLIFSLPFLVHYISRFMTLLPGDIISTGTPFGVGLGLHPPRYLKPGDVVELGIDGLGSSRQLVRAFRQPPL
ncbi:MAG: fumarylacetoacetate hydrolase family protein [Phaeodactylibacter sp.]|nr:fumarylacetoacetate hydrolase family protein [Phaeodactylibacter sp.]